MTPELQTHNSGERSGKVHQSEGLRRKETQKCLVHFSVQLIPEIRAKWQQIPLRKNHSQPATLNHDSCALMGSGRVPPLSQTPVMSQEGANYQHRLHTVSGVPGLQDQRAVFPKESDHGYFCISVIFGGEEALEFD